MNNNCKIIVDPQSGLRKVRFNKREDYWAYEDGTIRCGESPVRTLEEWYDSDMDLWWEAEGPYVFVGESYRHTFVEDVMVAVGFVNGDKSTMQSPVVLHRDGDFRNMASDNLEWVEETDPRFVAYCKKKYEAREARYKKINEGRILPDFPYWH